MSYASVVAKGGPQDPEEVAAPPLDTVIPTDESVASLIDVDTGVSVVSSDFLDQEVKTQTQAERLELEAAVEAEEEAARQAAAKRKANRSKQAGQDVLVWFKDPINSGNALLSTIVAVTLGVVGWRKYKAGEFSWSTAGIGAGILAGFSLVDYYGTQFAQKFVAKRKQN